MKHVRIGAVLTVLALCLALVAPTAATARAERAPSPAEPGKYRGTTLDEGESVRSEFVELQVTRDGKVKGFRARLGMYCYVGPPMYTQIIPTVIEAPTMKIRKGRIKRGWTEVYEVGDAADVIRGRLVITFRRGRPVKGKVAVTFASCGTTTGTPAGYIPFEVRRG